MRIRIKAPSAPQLIKELQPHLPLPVYLTPEICQSLSAKGKLCARTKNSLSPHCSIPATWAVSFAR